MYDRQRPPGHVHTEADWSDTAAAIGAYPLSKTLAERAAWDFIAGDRSGMSLVGDQSVRGARAGP